MADILDSVLAQLKDIPLAPQNARTPGQGNWTPTIGSEALSEVQPQGALVQPRTFPEPMAPEEELAMLQDFSVGLPGEEAPVPAQPMDPNPGEPEGETKVRQMAIAASQNDKAPTPTVDKLITEKPNASVEEVTAAYSKDKSAQAVQAAKESGTWTQGFEDAWNGFTDKVDLFTLGTALLATNGNGRPLVANLGMAIAAGTQAREAQVALGLENERVEQKMAIEERKVAAAEMSASARMANAISARRKALAEASGIEYKTATKRSKAAASLAAAESGIDMSIWEDRDGNKMDADDILEVIGGDIETMMNAANPMELADPTYQSRVARQAWHNFMKKHAVEHKAGMFTRDRYEINAD